MRVMQMAARIPERYSGLRQDVETAAKIVTNFEAKVKAVKADQNLTEAGKWDALRKELAGGAVSHLSQLEKVNRAALASLAAQKQALMPAVKDRTNPVAEMRRAELRAFLRGLPQEDRIKQALSGDSAIIEAIVDMPAALSGLSDDLKSKAVDVYIAKTNAETIARIEADQDALENVATALTLAKMDLSKIAGGPVTLEAAE